MTPDPRHLAGAIGRHPVLFAAGVVLAVGALAMGLTKLRADFSHRGFYFEDDPILVTYDTFERRFGNDDAVVVAVRDADGVLDGDSLALVEALAQGLERMPGIVRVDSLLSVPIPSLPSGEALPHARPDPPLEVRAAALEVAARAGALPGFAIASDHRTTLLLASVAVGAPALEITRNVDALIAGLDDGHHEIHVSGAPAITAAFEDAAAGDLSMLIPLLTLVTVVLLLLAFRSLVSLVVALLIVAASVVATLGLAGWLGIEMNNLTLAVPQILTAVGIALAVHFLSSYHLALRRGASSRDALTTALRKNLEPTLLTSVTTAMGFFSLTTSDLKPVVGLGILAGAGTLLAWGFALGLLPLLMLSGHRHRRPHVTAGVALRGQQRAHLWLDGLIRRKGLVVVCYALVVATAILAATRVTVNSDPIGYFAEDVPVRRAHRFIEDEMGGVRGIEVVVATGGAGGIDRPGVRQRIGELEDWLRADPQVTRVLSPLQPGGPSDPGDSPRWVTPSGDAVRLSVFWTIPTSRETMQAVARIEGQLRLLGLDGQVTGKTLLYQSMNGHVVRSFLRSMLAAFVLISLFLAVVLRSLRLGAIALIPNVIPLLAGAIVLWLLDRPLDIGTVVVASVCLGIAVDDTIHIITGFNRGRRDGLAPRQALIDVLEHRAPALILTTGILVAAFGTFVFGSFLPNVTFGILCSAILTLALVMDLTFLPVVLGGAHPRDGALARNTPESDPVGGSSQATEPSPVPAGDLPGRRRIASATIGDTTSSQ